MAVSSLKGKQVLVTGASSGIGYETALAFARRGANLILVDINATALDTTSHVVREHGVKCLTWKADVSDAQAMGELADAVHEAVGALDVLVNNAGIAFLGAFLETPMHAWRRILDINVMGVVHGCSAFLPRMIEAGGPRRLVNVASVAGLAPAYQMAAYAASKHAVVGLSESLAMELSGSEVGVSVIFPGIINTPIARPGTASVGKNVTDAQLERLAAFYQGKGAHPRVVAESIVDAVQAEKSIVLVGPIARLVYNLRRISRTLLMKAMLAESRKIWV
ncbi:SDR family NAD(P)-dependent oxidoreductase [Paraburkholderia guartelaensis]|uniref:SDR family NAD(P)-dependent oxidoreductase n=1 Tax=Paraburkholderia guartelaensis TaxID=2546446 RepID=A0A4R5L277_9BURK|nr:SDR family NAD(P)-dependent oxidoreductase [Paraburkholderia guartelaensis]TDG02453.1 SDR family NAD(P)-dependent oxidoreductase [Paraburkholderia guartelaensis]